MWGIIGNEAEVAFLHGSIIAGRWSHAYLITGPAFSGKYALAIQFAKALNCLGIEKPCHTCSQCDRIQNRKHVDVIAMDIQQEAQAADEDSNQLATLRGIARSLALTPVEGVVRVVILENADRISYEAQSSCLKLLEDPPPNVVIIMLATSPQDVLNTLRSRCVELNLGPMSFEAMMHYLIEGKQLSQESATIIARAAKGLPELADSLISNENWQTELENDFEQFMQLLRAPIPERLRMVAILEKEVGKSRDDVVNLLRLWIGWYRDILMTEYGLGQGMLRSRVKGEGEGVDYRADPDTVAQCINLVNETIRNIKVNANIRLSLERLVIML